MYEGQIEEILALTRRHTLVTGLGSSGAQEESLRERSGTNPVAHILGYILTVKPQNEKCWGADLNCANMHSSCLALFLLAGTSA